MTQRALPHAQLPDLARARDRRHALVDGVELLSAVPAPRLELDVERATSSLTPDVPGAQQPHLVLARLARVERLVCEGERAEQRGNEDRQENDHLHEA